MAVYICVCNRQGIFFDYENVPSDIYQEYIGTIDTESSNIAYDFYHLPNVGLIKYVCLGDYVVFNSKQILHLEQEVRFLLEHTIGDQKVLELINKAISIAKKNPDMYLKFDVD